MTPVEFSEFAWSTGPWVMLFVLVLHFKRWHEGYITRTEREMSRLHERLAALEGKRTLVVDAPLPVVEEADVAPLPVARVVSR